MKTTLENNTLTLCLEGRIDTNNAAEVEKEIFSAIEGKTEDIVLDAKKLEYISSAGLRVLMKLRKSLDKPLPMINVSRDVYDILETAGFTEQLELLSHRCAAFALMRMATTLGIDSENKKKYAENQTNGMIALLRQQLFPNTENFCKLFAMPV